MKHSVKFLLETKCSVFLFCCYHIVVIYTETKSTELTWTELISVIRGQRPLQTEELILLKLHKDWRTSRGTERKENFNKCDRNRKKHFKTDWREKLTEWEWRLKYSTKCQKISEKTEFFKLRHINRITSFSLKTWD